MTLQPIYTAENCGIAYQLNWSVTLFARLPLPEQDCWLEPLRTALEKDGVRILEQRLLQPDIAQLLVSTRPEVSPAAMLRVVKGRWQYLLRDEIPKLWQRNYFVTSVGEANNAVLEAYVARQAEHHRLADARVRERLAEASFVDATVDMEHRRSSEHGQFVHNLQVVLETAEHLTDVRTNWLDSIREWVVKVCAKKTWLLSRLGLVHNHVHLLLGCDVCDAPRDVARSLMNNLAYGQDMKPVFAFGLYVGTFGGYDRDAIRRKITPGLAPGES